MSIFTKKQAILSVTYKYTEQCERGLSGGSFSKKMRIIRLQLLIGVLSEVAEESSKNKHLSFIIPLSSIHHTMIDYHIKITKESFKL